MAENTLKTISIDQLKIGVFVTKLDIPWMESPFIGSTRLIKKQTEIDKLIAAGAKRIVIDVAKGLDVSASKTLENPSAESKTSDNIPKKPTSVGGSLSNETNIESKPSVKQEMGAALIIRQKINQTLDKIQQAIKTESSMDAGVLQELVDDTLQSLSRNDQALLSLVHISRKTQKLADHTFGTFCLSLNLAITRDVPQKEREELGLAALFHEAGWSGLPINLMGKRTKYSENERKLVEKHTLLAEKILQNFNLPESTRRIIAEHHELLDGSGYPNQLKEVDLHPLTQILTVVDTYEERVHQLMDKPGMLPTNALKSLYQDAETGKLSPKIVASLIAMLGIYPPTTAILLNTGEKGIVLEVRVDAPLQPLIAIYYDKSGLAHVEPQIVDLFKKERADKQRTIVGALDLLLPDSDPAHCLKVTDNNLIL